MKRSQRKGQLQMPMELKTHKRPVRPRRNARMAIGPNIFGILFSHKMPRVDALSELIDNAFGPAAGNAMMVRISFSKNKVTVYDDGVGVRDLNAIMTPGESGSRDNAEDIGSFGIGAKFGMFHFGKAVKIDTVHQGRRHQHSIDFGLAQEQNKMPLLYRGHGIPTKLKGTSIIVTDLHQGRHNPSYTHLCSSLAHRYLLAQRQGRKIIMRWPGAKDDVELKAEDIVALYEQDIREYNGEVNGKKFTVLAGDTKEYDPLLHGLHIGYGFRFITKLTELAGHALPSLFYGRLILGNEWKTSLSTDKTEIVVDRDALEEQTYELLRDWIEQLRKVAEEYRSEQICAKLSLALQDIIRATDDGDDHVEGEPTPAHADGGDGGTDPGPGPKDKVPRAEPQANGNKGADPFKRTDTGIRFKIEPLGGGNTTPCIIQEEDDSLVVTLNEDIPIIAKAWEAPFKLPVIWSITSLALAAKMAIDIPLAKRVLCNQQLLESVDPNAPETLFSAISTIAAYLMRAVPDNKAFIEEAIDERSYQSGSAVQ